MRIVRGSSDCQVIRRMCHFVDRKYDYAFILASVTVCTVYEATVKVRWAVSRWTAVSCRSVAWSVILLLIRPNTPPPAATHHTLDPTLTQTQTYITILDLTPTCLHRQRVQFQQLQRSRRSLGTESAAKLVHSFVVSRIDYCNAVLAGAPKATTNKLQRVLNAAARVISGTHKFDRGLLRLLHTELHWLDVPERVVYKLGVIVFNCLHGQAPQYLVELCQPVASWQHLICHPTASSRTVPQLSSYGRLCRWSVALKFPPG